MPLPVACDVLDRLDALACPTKEVGRREYRRIVTAHVAAMSFEDLRVLCRFFRCDVTTVVTRIMDYEYARLRRQAALERAARRAARKAGTR